MGLEVGGELVSWGYRINDACPQTVAILEMEFTVKTVTPESKITMRNLSRVFAFISVITFTIFFIIFLFQFFASLKGRGWPPHPPPSKSAPVMYPSYH